MYVNDLMKNEWTIPNKALISWSIEEPYLLVETIDSPYN